MTNISNPFAPNGRHLLSTYTISTPQSVDIADNQKGYGCILKFTRFYYRVNLNGTVGQKEKWSEARRPEFGAPGVSR